MPQVEQYWRNAGLAWLSDMLVRPSLYSDDGSKIDRGACGEVAAIHFDVLTAEQPISARIWSLCSAKHNHNHNHNSLRMVKKHMFIQSYHVILTGVLQASTASSALLIARKIENKIGTDSLLIRSTCKTDNRGLQREDVRTEIQKETN